MMIRHAILFLLLAAVLTAGCSPEPVPPKKAPASGNTVHPAIRAGAASAPLGTILQAVGGPFVSVAVALPAGRSAHEYELSARETAALAGCRFYLTQGLPFERHLPSVMKGAKISAPIAEKTLPVLLASEDEHGHGTADPHIFLHPENNIALAKTVSAAFAELDPAHSAEYRKNAAEFIAHQTALQKEIAAELAPFRGRKFYVQHPAFAYFGAAYGLTQTALEEHASGSSAKELADCIREAKREHIRGILVQKESNSAPAQVIAHAIGGRLLEVDPLSPDLFAAQKRIADAIRESLQ